MKNKILFGLSLAVFGCAGAVTYMDTAQPPVHAPERVKAEAFTSKPMQLTSSGLIRCEDGSIWALVQVVKDGPFVATMLIPPMEATNASK